MRLLTLFGAAILFAGISPAEKPAEKREATPIPAAKPAGHSASPRTAAATSPSSAITDTWLTFTVQPGAVYKLTTTTDYTGADHISVAIECPVGNSLQPVSIAVFWANSVVPYFVQTDNILGSNFPLTNMGGAVVPVYGPTLLLEIVNSGTAAISCDQVTAYATVH
jgi:hypothetical protein